MSMSESAEPAVLSAIISTVSELSSASVYTTVILAEPGKPSLALFTVVVN